jgi:hypothetical protein
MIVVACGVTLYPKACNKALYFDSCTLGVMTQEVAMILTNIALDKGSNAMVNA